MVISFNKNKNIEKWEMECNSADLARNWEKTINANIQYMKQEANNTSEKIVVDPVKKSQVQNVEQEPFQGPPRKPMVKMEEQEEDKLKNNQNNQNNQGMVNNTA